MRKNRQKKKAKRNNDIKCKSDEKIKHFVSWRHDIQHNDTQHNNTQHNDTQHNDTQHKDIQHNDTQHNEWFSRLISPLC
jgi:hypothetical protein